MSSNAQSFQDITNLETWSLTGGWTRSILGLEYVHNNNTDYAFSAPFSVSNGTTYVIEITIQVASGSGVLEIGFGNDTDNFTPSFVRALPALKNISKDYDNDNDNDDQAHPIILRLEFEFTGEGNTSVIFRVQTTAVDFYVVQIATTEESQATSNPQVCSGYLGFSPFSIQRLLTCRSATKLVGHVDDVLNRLQHLKTKVVAGGARLTQVINYGEWIHVLNSFNEGSACGMNFRDFDLYNWLINHQINFALNKYHGEALTKKRSNEPWFGRTFLKAPVFKKSLIDDSFEIENIF